MSRQHPAPHEPGSTYQHSKNIGGLEDWIQRQCETKDRLVIRDPVKEKSTLPKRVRVKWHIATNFQVR